MDCPICGRPTVKPHKHPGRHTVPDALSRMHTETMAALLGLSRVEAIRAQCGKSCWLPTDSGGWRKVVCPLISPHTMHADENNFPCFTDDDATFFNEQHRLATA